MKSTDHFRKRKLILVIAFASLGLGVIVGWKPLLLNYRLKRAKQELAKRNDAQALEWLLASERLVPDHPETHFWLARTYRRLGRLGEMRGHILRAHELGFPVERLRREEWLAEAQSGQMRLAEPHLDELLLQPGDDGPEILDAFVNGYLKLQRYDRVTMLLSGWKSNYQDDPQPHYYEGRILAAHQHHKEAVPCFHRSLELAADRLDVRTALGNSHVGLHQFDEAEKQFRTVLRTDHTNTQAQMGLVRCLIPDQKYQEARSLLMDILDRDEHHLAARINLAQLDLGNGKPRDALKWVEPILEKNQRHIPLRQVYASALRSTGRIDQARSHFAFVKEADDAMGRVQVLRDRLMKSPKRADLRFQIAELLMKYGTQAEAALWLGTVLEHEPDHQGAIRMLAEYYDRSGHTYKAGKYRSRLKLNP